VVDGAPDLSLFAGKSRAGELALPENARSTNTFGQFKTLAEADRG
jgi:hypothetical protein